MAMARRVSLFEREVSVRLAPVAIELIHGAARVLSEGELEGRTFSGSTMLTVDLRRTADRISERLEARRQAHNPHGARATIINSGATKARFQQIRQLSGIRGLMAGPGRDGSMTTSASAAAARGRRPAKAAHPAAAAAFITGCAPVALTGFRLVMVEDGGRDAGFAFGVLPPSFLKKSPNEDLDFTASTFAIRLS